ncbi:MAG: DNA-processing protein DprA [Planctomycetota bacterium]
MRSLAPGDPAWPPLFQRVTPSPGVLYVRGTGLPLRKPVVAIVGSRRASPLGRRQAYRLGRELAALGFVVVSGLARGIDSAALEGALATGVAHGTGAFLGNGFPEVYPPEARDLAERIVSSGGFVATEYAPGSPPRKHHFPFRNRLISGIALGVVVVEAALRSGSLTTVGWALDQGCEVMAYPGPVEGPQYEGCHQLLREGAALVTGSLDVLRVLGFPDPTP